MMTSRDETQLYVYWRRKRSWRKKTLKQTQRTETNEIVVAMPRDATHSSMYSIIYQKFTVWLSVDTFTRVVVQCVPALFFLSFLSSAVAANQGRRCEDGPDFTGALRRILVR